jgi:hypothetical protein
MGDGAVQAYHNEAMSQEMVYQTAGGAAETLTGGVTMNLVPKDGGNQFRGGAKWPKSPESWQGDNLTDDLKAMGVTGVDRIKHFEEVNIEQAARPQEQAVLRAFRQAYYDKPIANTFQTDGSLPYPQAYAQCVQTKNCEQGVSDEKMANPVARLTWQMSERNKFAVYMDRALRLRGHAMGSLTDPNTASVIWNTPTFATGSASGRRRCRPSCCSKSAPRSTASATTTCISPASSPSAAPRWYATCARTTPARSYLERVGAQLATIPIANFQGSLLRRARTTPSRRWISSGSIAATTTPMPISTRPTRTAPRCASPC